MEQTAQPGSTRDALLRAARDELTERGHASVSLRAVARRAGVSHAAPAHFFGDRAGMLTAVAIDGFHQLAEALGASEELEPDGGSKLASIGRSYVDFGLENPALFDLMFRRSELSPDDPELIAAQGESLGMLREAVAEVAPGDCEQWSLVSWAVVHGLVTLVREGVLARIVERGSDAKVDDLARELVDFFAVGVGTAAGGSRSST